MNVKGFLVASMSSALDNGIALPDDILRHVTATMLAEQLPRPLWARLLTACMGAPRIDPQLVVETIGVPNLCEHVPTPVIWGCLNEIAQRTIDGAPLPAPGFTVAPAVTTAPTPLAFSRREPLSTPPPPEENRPPPAAMPIAVGPSIPSPALGESETDSSDDRPPTRARTSSQRFRQSATGIGRLAGTNVRRPQASASPSEPVLPRPRRSGTEGDYDVETDVGEKEDWKNALAVEDEQLVDWTASDETVSGADDLNPRKR
ncbi:MAG: hypothetical protein WKG01_38025 [Kofleriaceae bacterium]